MPRRIPPLNSLKAFEAVARMHSFTKAADDLCVTTAAVSQQIKLLEEYLDLKLFNRTNKSLQLTEAGKLYYPLLSKAFDTMALATQQMENFTETKRLNVSILPSMASQWLGTKLFNWCADHSDIDVNIKATHIEPNFDSSDVDFRITYGAPKDSGLLSHKLFTDSVSPVCSPKLITAKSPLNSPQDLKKHSLLHIDWGKEYNSLPTWSEWFTRADIKDMTNIAGPTFNLSSMAIQAAIEGEGVILGQSVMVENELTSGKLIKPFDIDIPLGESYYVLCRQSVMERPHAIMFLDWLKSISPDL